MTRRLVLMALAAATLPSLAPAGDPARLPATLNVTLTKDLAADPATVWAVIGDFQDMSWHPAVHAVTGSGGNGAGATRRLVPGGADGPTIDEALDSHSPATLRYAYRITGVALEVLPVTQGSSHLRVTPRDGDGATVAWRGDFHRGDPDTDPPEGLDDAVAIAAVSDVYQAGFDALAARFGAPAP